MREGKKHLRKEDIKPIFRKVNEGDEIKKTFDLFKLTKATKTTSKKIKLEKCFLSPEINFFFLMFFLFSKLTVLFRLLQHSDARTGQKNRPESNASVFP